MAELSHQERLQPSLLDRLTDDEPSRAAEPRERRVLSVAQVRESVRRDLAWLFNTTQLGATEARIGEDPLLAGSVLNYGIPDLAGRRAAGLDVRALENLLRQAIWDFEPRLLRHSVNVRGIVAEGELSHRYLSFVVEGDLWAQPVPLRLYLQTQVDLEDGTVQIGEAGPRGGG